MADIPTKKPAMVDVTPVLPVFNERENLPELHRRIREVIKNVSLYGEMHRFIPAIPNWMGTSIAEIEVAHHPRVHAASKYGISRNPLFLGAILFFLVGIQFIVLGLMAEIVIRVYHEAPGKRTYAVKRIIGDVDRSDGP